MKRKRISALILAGLMDRRLRVWTIVRIRHRIRLCCLRPVTGGRDDASAKADLKILTSRIDLIDTDFADYIAQF